MKIQPTNHRILVQLYLPGELAIQLTESSFDPLADEHRVRLEVLEVAPDVTLCKKGDFILVPTGAEQNMIPINRDPKTALIHDSMVLGITDDIAPLQLA